MDALKILYLEDNEMDAELVRHILVRDGLTPELDRVWTKANFEAKLGAGQFNIILCDNRLPSFDGLSALAMAKKKRPEIPFIFVSGTIGEEAAVEALKGGATDYVLKDRLGRLPSAVRRAVEMSEERSKRREAEESLRQVQKLEAIGLLAGGVAHDFNNLLTVINGRSMLMMRRLPLEDPARKEFELIYKTGERAAALTRQLLAFSSKQKMQMQVVNLNSIVTDLHKMLRRLISKNVALELALEPSLPNITADAGQIEQVIMNLVVNARDAIAGDGKIVIETSEFTTTEERKFDSAVVTPGTYVLLTVSDTGMGMSQETMARIFEPFFTTKALGKGTGLGLATVYGIVNQVGGKVWVRSKLAKGSVFSVLLPATAQAVNINANESGAQAFVGGAETILVVEDDEGIQSMISEILQMEGYKVIVAGNGVDAIKTVQALDDPLNLLITDVIMPYMGGVDLARALRGIKKDLKVLFITGYEAGDIGPGEFDSLNASFLPKPFTPPSLLRKVRSILLGNSP